MVPMYEMKLPSRENLEAMKKEQRINLFRKFLAISRYNRLILHHELVKSTNNFLSRSHIDDLNKVFIDRYCEFVDHIKNNGYNDEFLDAVKEEDLALQRIILAYEKRMLMNA
jgi:hypothetical protein